MQYLKPDLLYNLLNLLGQVCNLNNYSPQNNHTRLQIGVENLASISTMVNTTRLCSLVNSEGVSELVIDENDVYIKDYSYSFRDSLGLDYLDYRILMNYCPIEVIYYSIADDHQRQDFIKFFAATFRLFITKRSCVCTVNNHQGFQQNKRPEAVKVEAYAKVPDSYEDVNWHWYIALGTVGSVCFVNMMFTLELMRKYFKLKRILQESMFEEKKN